MKKKIETEILVDLSDITYKVKEDGNPSPVTSVCSYKRGLMSKPESCGICNFQFAG